MAQRGDMLSCAALVSKKASSQVLVLAGHHAVGWIARRVYEPNAS
jgi:hypothetical protein